MNLTISLSNEDLSPEQRKLVQEALGLRTDAELLAAMTKLCKTATIEYINMFVETGIPSRADELRQARVYFLISHYYERRLPSEFELSSIFQLTTSQSRTLLRNTRSRYRTKIRAQVNSSAKQVIAGAQKNDRDRWEMLINSDVIVEELNLVVAKKGPSLNPIHLKKDSAGKYEAEEDTYRLLKKEYNVS